MYAKRYYIGSGGNNNKLGESTTYTGEGYGLLPVQYTELTHQLMKFQIYRFLWLKYLADNIIIILLYLSLCLSDCTQSSCQYQYFCYMCIVI